MTSGAPPPAIESPPVFRALEPLIGVEQSPSALHRVLRRVLSSVRPTSGSGAVLVSCSDEVCGDYRVQFERDLARPLGSPAATGFLSTFATTNLGARVETGALGLAADHFAMDREASDPLLLVLCVAAHVGRHGSGARAVYGQIDRGGVVSPCCGALAGLAVERTGDPALYPTWRLELGHAFGTERERGLAELEPRTRAVAAAVVHAVLQSERLAAEALSVVLPVPAHIVLLPVVLVNQRGPDGILLAGVQHLWTAAGSTAVVYGATLRTTPTALAITEERGRLAISGEVPESGVALPEQGAAATSTSEMEAARAGARQRLVEAASGLSAEQRELLRAHGAELRRGVEQVGESQASARVWARPLLRSACEALTFVAPEFGLALFAAEGAHSFRRARHVRQLLERGPSTSEARQVLRGIEAEIQQLPHDEALEVLQVLAGEAGPLLG